jgi:single-strand DNA-binding protein
MMNSLNSILIEGNLAQNPILQTTPEGTSLCTFSIAFNRYYKRDSELEQEVSYFDVEVWDRLAENVHCLGSRGRGVRIVGRIRQYRWNGADRTDHSKVIIVAEHIEFRPSLDDRDSEGDE